MVYKFFDFLPSGSDVNNEITQHGQLAEELNKTIIKSFKKRKVYFLIKDNILVLI